MADELLRSLTEQVNALAQRIVNLEDVHAIRTLQHKYGYYIDKCLYDETVELFADGARLYFLNGIYKGKAGVRRLYCDWFRNLFTGGHNGPIPAFLLDHPQMQDIVDVAADGLTAKGRFRSLMQGGQHESKPEKIEHFPMQCWEAGIYENEYVKERGVWKIQVLNYNMLWQADYEKGWAYDKPHLLPLDKTYPESPIGPDELLAETPKFWPDTRIVAFHFPHPVTGKWVK